MKKTFAGLLVAIFLSANAFAAGLSAYLTDNTVAVVQAPNMPELLRAFDASPLNALYHDPAAADYFRALNKELDRAKLRLVARGSVSDRELKSFATGQAILAAMLPPAGMGRDLQWVLLVEHGNDPQVMQALKAGPRPTGASFVKTDEPVGSLRVTHMRFVKEIRTKIPGDKSGLKALKQVSEDYDEYLDSRVFAFGPSKGEPVRRIVERIGRIHAGESLSAPLVFSIGSKLKAPGQVQLLIDVGRLSALLTKPEKKAREISLFNPRGLGLEGMKAAAAIDIRPAQVMTHVTIETAAQPRGASKMILLASPLTTGTATLVPANATAYGAVGYPLPEGWTALRALMATATPAFEITLESQFAAILQATGHDLNGNLFGSLGDVFSRFVWPGSGGKTQFQQSTYIVRLKDEKKFRDSLEVLLTHLSQGMMLYQIEKTEYLGRPVWSLRAGRPDVSTQAEPVFWLAVADHHAIGSARPEGLREVVRLLQQGGADSLAQHTEYRAALAGLPASRQGEWFIDIAKSSGVLEMTPPIKAAADQTKISAIMPKEGKGFGEIWARYFHPLGAVRTVESNRVTIDARILAK